jgi:hypothetical protein
MKKNRLFKVMCSLALGATVLVSCESDSQTVPQDQGIEQISEKLVSLGFNVDMLHETTFNGQQGYAVEGDIFLTAEEINSMMPAHTISNHEVKTEHYRTNNVVSAPRTISVYMDAEFNSTMQAAFDDALARYNALGLGLTFQRASSEGADIDVLSEKLKRYMGYTILGRSAGFPDEYGNPATPIVLNSDVYNPRRGSIPADAATVIAHEIGHAIGFRHTDYMDRSFSCGGSYSNEGPSDVGAVYIPGTPSGPENGSYMLACSNGTDRPFTAGDVTALNTVY